MRDHPEISEARLHTLWQEQKIPREYLRTSAGQPVEIINAGQYNHEGGGPDFRRATLHLGEQILQGDIEIHVHAGDWAAHGHHLDPAYNDVILHLALIPSHSPESAFTILRENGLPVLQMLLPAEILPAPAENQSLFFCPLSQTSSEKILATVRLAGGLRLEAKAHALAEQLLQAAWDQVLYRGMAEALGYDKNQEAFRRLAELLPIELLFAELRAAREIAPEVLLEALLFGAAGFLSHETIDAETSAFVAPRLALWEELRHTLQIRPLRREAWQFFRLRPPNFPPRRLAALSALILKFYRAGILEHALGMVTALGKQPQRLVYELLQHVLCPAAGFWQWHYDLRGRQPAAHRLVRAGDLIGRERALDIVANILMPALWLYYREAGDGVLQSQVQEAYGALPKLQENQITRRMRQQLSAKYPLQKKTAETAAGQQGLIHLQKLYCRPLRCEECLALSEKR